MARGGHKYAMIPQYGVESNHKRNDLDNDSSDSGGRRRKHYDRNKDYRGHRDDRFRRRDFKDSRQNNRR